jgi:hypothetical protein
MDRNHLMAPSYEKQERLLMVFLLHCYQCFHFVCIDLTKKTSASQIIRW